MPPGVEVLALRASTPLQPRLRINVIKPRNCASHSIFFHQRQDWKLSFIQDFLSSTTRLGLPNSVQPHLVVEDQNVAHYGTPSVNK